MILFKCCTHYASKFGKLSSGHRTGKGQFSFQPQRRAMPKNAQLCRILHNCPHLTCQQNNVQNPSSEAAMVCEPRTSRCTSWIQKWQKNQRSNFKHLLDHRKSKEIPEKLLLLLGFCCFCPLLCSSLYEIFTWHLKFS